MGTRKKSRREMNKATNLEMFRLQMDFKATLARIMDIEGKLLAMCEPQTVFTEDGDMQIVMIQPNAGVVAAMKTVLDSCWKRMAKVLPDIKAQDVHDAVGGDVSDEEDLPLMDMIEFKRRLRMQIVSKQVNEKNTRKAAVKAAAKAAEENTPSFLK